MSGEIKIESKNKINKKLLLGVAVLIAFALVAVLAIFVPKTANAKKVQEQLNLGEKYLSELNYERAEAVYLAVIEIDPKNVDAYIGLADVYVTQGEYDKAVEVLEDALEKLDGDAKEAVSERLTEVQSVRAAAEVTPTNTPAPTSTPVPTPTPAPTSTPVPTPTNIPAPPTSTPTPEPTATSTPTPEPTATNTPTPKPTATNTPTSEPTATSTPTPEPTATSTPTPKITVTPEAPIYSFTCSVNDDGTCVLSNYSFLIKDYLDDYQAGEKVKITVKLSSSSYFGGAIGGNDLNNGWIQNIFQNTNDMTAIAELTLVEEYNGNGNIYVELYWMGDQSQLETQKVNIDSIVINRVEEESTEILVPSPTSTPTPTPSPEPKAVLVEILVQDAEGKSLEDAEVILTDETGVLHKAAYIGSSTYIITLQEGYYDLDISCHGYKSIETAFWANGAVVFLEWALEEEAMSWDYGEIAGHRYQFIEAGDMEWNEVVELCRMLGGYLAVISSEIENDFLYQMLRNNGYYNAYFGYSDVEEEGNWKWLSGESSYENWADGEPNDDCGGEDYAMFYYMFEDGKWNDGNFGHGTLNDDKVFICEWDTLE